MRLRAKAPGWGGGVTGALVPSPAPTYDSGMEIADQPATHQLVGPSRALVFAGGGLKGAAYVGALRALQEAGMTFDLFGGASAGSIVAVLCGAGFSTDQMRSLMGDLAALPPRRLRDFNLRGLLSLLSLSARGYQGLYRGDLLEGYLEELLGGFGIRHFADLPFPTFTVAVNVLDDTELVCTNLPRCDVRADCHASDVPVASALRASTSLPGVFVPKRLRDGLYVDGGVRSLLPLVVARRLGATEVLGLAFARGRSTQQQVLGSGVVSILSRTVDLLLVDQVESEVSLLQAEGLQPSVLELEVGDPEIFDLREIPALIERGYAATKAQLELDLALVARFAS